MPSISWKRRRKSSLALLTIAALAAALFWPLPPSVRPAYSRVVLARDGSLLRAYLSPDQKWRFRTRSADLPAHVTEGLLCLEDRYFRRHPGVNPLAIGRAFRQNQVAGRTVSGASTLTMQVARLLRPAPRDLRHKVLEAWRALRLEAQLDKRQILDLYLSYAPFGGNLEGLEAGAQRFFGKPARLLTAADAAFLFLLPQSPRRWSERDSLNLKNLRDRQLGRFRDCGVIGEDEYRSAKAERIPEWRGAFEIHAGHAADWALRQTAADRVETTIDIHLQKSVEELVRAQEAELRAKGILNAGLLAVDNESGEILAAIGNFDVRRGGDAQQFNSFLVPRSTGSLLKPFLFARLLESGDIVPESLLEDVPLNLNGYRPENYTGEFQGLVEARMALAHSLNVPWIRALKEHGVDGFMTFLLSTGLRTPQTANDVGLSMVVGGLQANLKDMTMLYRALAADGNLRGLSVLKGESAKHKSWSWINPGAAHLTREALKIRGRPDFAIDPSYLTHTSARWKTGTSQGNRDAWAVGFDPDFTIGVWLGNLDQTAVPALVGPEVAAPLMFDALARLRRHASHPRGEWRAAGTQMIEVCAFSGLPADSACPHKKSVVGIKGLAMRSRCPYHQHILVDQNSGYRITRECETPGMRPRVKSVLEMGADVAAWTHRNLPGLDLAPRFHPKCTEKPVAGGGLQILSPQASSYVLHRSGGADFLRVPLRVKTAQTAGHWHCYLNGVPLADSEDEGAQLRARPGQHALLCSDEQGRSDQVEFSVEL